MLPNGRDKEVVREKHHTRGLLLATAAAASHLIRGQLTFPTFLLASALTEEEALRDRKDFLSSAQLFPTRFDERWKKTGAAPRPDQGDDGRWQ